MFEAFVMPFKMKKLQFILILSAHFVMTSQERKLSKKDVLMDDDWEKPFPGQNDYDFGADSIVNPKEAEDDPSLKSFLKDSGWEEIQPEVTPEIKDETKNKVQYDISLKHQISVGGDTHRRKPAAANHAAVTNHVVTNTHAVANNAAAERMVASQVMVKNEVANAAVANDGHNSWEKIYPPPKVIFEAVHAIKKTTKPASPIAVMGEWMSWSVWSNCTAPCNVGVQSRRRVCTLSYPNCKMSSIEKRICILKTCHQGQQKSTLKILQGRDATLRCYGRNIDMKHIGLVWLTPYGKVIPPTNKPTKRFHAERDVLHITSVQKIDSGLYHCVWPPFKTGTGISLDVETCESSPCKNDGNCLESFIDQSLRKKSTCVCTRKYRGSRCERAKSTPRKTGILFIGLIVCALLATIIFLCCCLSMIRTSSGEYKSGHDFTFYFGTETNNRSQSRK